MGFLIGLGVGVSVGAIVMLVSLALVRFCKIDDRVDETGNNMGKISRAEKHEL